MSLLIVTAVAAEAEAIRKGLGPDSPITVAPVGVGMAAAAAGTAKLLTLASGRYRGVISAGIAGGIGLEPGTIVLGLHSIAADLGADSSEGFIGLDELGFGPTVSKVDGKLLTSLREALPAATVGDVLTVNTVTGSASRLSELKARYPNAVAESMEGFGVACAATLSDVAFAELRTISNLVGPRDRASWRIPDALAALAASAESLANSAAAV